MSKNPVAVDRLDYTKQGETMNNHGDDSRTAERGWMKGVDASEEAASPFSRSRARRALDSGLGGSVLS